MALNVGNEVWVEYVGGGGMAHHRVLLCHSAGAEWMVATPDGDLYEESMSRHDPDVNNLWLVPAAGVFQRGYRVQVGGTTGASAGSLR